MKSYLKIHKILSSTYSNGPGNRFGIWVQGCSLKCPGCFNPETHSFENGIEIRIEAIIDQILAVKDEIEGITISGGEPFDQEEAILTLIKEIREKTNLGIIIFSGYDHSELIRREKFLQISKNIDLLIAGRFIKEKYEPRGLKGSSNKKLLFFSDRYNIQDLEATPLAELIIKNDEIIITGIKPDVFRGILND